MCATESERIKSRIDCTSCACWPENHSHSCHLVRSGGLRKKMQVTFWEIIASQYKSAHIHKSEYFFMQLSQFRDCANYWTKCASRCRTMRSNFIFYYRIFFINLKLLRNFSAQEFHFIASNFPVYFNALRFRILWEYFQSTLLHSSQKNIAKYFPHKSFLP